MGRSRVTVWATLGFGAAFLAWTLLLPTRLDALWPWPPVPESSMAGRAAATVALVLSPAVVYPALLIVAWWASRRRFTALARAAVLAVALGALGATGLKFVVGRARPESPWHYLVGEDSLSYPSAHVVSITVAALMAGVLVTAMRRPWRVLAVTHAAGALLISVVAVDRLVLGAHYVTDVVGGFLFGGLVTFGACWIADVHTLPPALASGDPRRLAVIYHPLKVRDLSVLHGLIGREAAARGWEPPIWLATSEHDPGGGMARAAVESSADLVLVVGGDGTVREVCAALDGTGTHVGIVPSGTANLLARNLGVPLDAGHALDAALDGVPTPMDLMRYEDLDGGGGGVAAVMIGLGADAAVLSDTNEALKRAIGPAAYVWAGLGHIRARPVEARVVVDGGEPIARDASLVEVGNVGDLYPGVSLMPAASAHDGTLEVLVASPQSSTDVARMIGGVLRRASEEPLIDRTSGRLVEVEFARPVLCQVDGDVVGEVRRILLEVVPDAVRVVLPPGTPGSSRP